MLLLRNTINVTSNCLIIADGMYPDRVLMMCEQDEAECTFK